MDSKRRPCIFIADDNPNNIKVLSAMLEAKGYDIRVALDGEQALSSIRQSKPDLILLDVHMPKMDGYEVCQALKSDEDLKGIGVVFISALSETFNKIQGFRLGAVDYIEKPFQIEEVEVRVDTQLKLRYQHELLQKRVHFSEERLKLAAEAGNIGVWEWRPDTDTLIWDERMFVIYGVDPKGFGADSHAWFSLIHEDDRARVEQEIQKGLAQNEKVEAEFKILKPDGTCAYAGIRAGVHPMGQGLGSRMLGVTLDVSERVLAEKARQKMEDRLRQSQKMESIGTMAGGIAHDFNNVLSGIFAYSSMVESHIHEPETVKKNIGQIVKGAQRATDLVQQILIFSRNQKAAKEPLQVESIVDEVISLLSPSIHPSVEVEKNNLSKTKIMADPTQIHQVAMNLFTNAIHALPDTGGKLTITLEDVRINETLHLGLDELGPGTYVSMEVADNGQGMDEYTLERIFDPYFTTKKSGEGTGLGLAVVSGIIQEHKGIIKAYSNEGKGSRFRVYLPAAG